MTCRTAVFLAAFGLVAVAQGHSAAWGEFYNGGAVTFDSELSSNDGTVGGEPSMDSVEEEPATNGSKARTGRVSLLFGLGAQSTSFCDQGELHRAWGMTPILAVQGKIAGGSDLQVGWHAKTKYIGDNECNEGIALISGGLTFLQSEELSLPLITEWSFGAAWWRRSDFDDEWGPAFTFGVGVLDDDGRGFLMTEASWAEPRKDWSVGLYVYVQALADLATPN